MPLNNGLQLPFGIQPVNPLPVDSWSGPYNGANEALAKAAANASIPGPIRFRTMEVRLLIGPSGSEVAYKYWYYGGTADSDLVPFLLGATGATGAQVAIYDSANNELTAGATALKFTGSGVSLSNSGAFVTVTVQGSTGSTGPATAIYNQSGGLISAGPTGLQFTGNGVNVTGVGDFVTVNVTGSTGNTGPSLAVYNVEGTQLTTGATGIQFIGTGVTVYANGNFITVGISGSNTGNVETTAPVTGDGSLAAPVELLYTNDFGLTADQLQLNLDFSNVTTPQINSTWTIWQYGAWNVTPLPTYSIANYGNIGHIMTANAIQVPDGVIFDFGGTATAPTPGSGQTPPTSTSGDWTWSPNPPVNGQTSYLSFTDQNDPATNTDETYSTTFAAPNTGLIVQNGRVVRAATTGNQSSGASATIVFKDVFYWGYSSYWGPDSALSNSAVTSLSGPAMAGIINGLNSLQYRFGGKNQTLSNVQDSSGTRLVMAYPSALGNLTSVKYAGILEILTTFIQSNTFNLTTISGATISYTAYVATSDNAYGNVSVITT
jgi:hypothetical protein